MSRGYRISWVTAGRTVTSSDHMKVPVSLLGILGEGEMSALLQAELEKDGWKRDADGSLSTTIEGVAVKLDRDAKELTLTSTAERRVQASAQTKGEVEAKLEKAAEAAARSIAASPAQTIAKAEPEVRARLGEAVQRVYRQALERKAASLGEVESVQETTNAAGEHEIVIKVRT